MIFKISTKIIATKNITFIYIYIYIYIYYILIYNSKVDSTADTYMLIEKRQVQPKEPEPASLVYKATEP